MFKRDGLNYRTVEMLIDGEPHTATVVTALNADETDTKNYGEKFYDIESIETQTNPSASYGAPNAGTNPHKIKMADSSSDKRTIAQKQRIVNRKNAAYSTGDSDTKTVMAAAFANAKTFKSTQETDNITARGLLARTDVATVKNDIERKRLEVSKPLQSILRKGEKIGQKLNDLHINFT